MKEEQQQQLAKAAVFQGLTSVELHESQTAGVGGDCRRQAEIGLDNGRKVQ